MLCSLFSRIAIFHTIPSGLCPNNPLCLFYKFPEAFSSVGGCARANPWGFSIITVLIGFYMGFFGRIKTARTILGDSQ